MLDGHQAPLLTTGQRLSRPRDDPNVFADLEIVGCTPGLGPAV